MSVRLCIPASTKHDPICLTTGLLGARHIQGRIKRRSYLGGCSFKLHPRWCAINVISRRAHSLSQCPPKVLNQGKTFLPVWREEFSGYRDSAQKESGIFAVRICLLELEKKMQVSGQLRPMVCWFTE